MKKGFDQSEKNPKKLSKDSAKCFEPYKKLCYTFNDDAKRTYGGDSGKKKYSFTCVLFCTCEFFNFHSYFKFQFTVGAPLINYLNSGNEIEENTDNLVAIGIPSYEILRTSSKFSYVMSVLTFH